MSARKQILTRVAQALGRKKFSEEVKGTFQELTKQLPPSEQPPIDGNLIDAFIAAAEKSSAIVKRIPTLSELPVLVANIGNGIHPVLISDQPALVFLDWSNILSASDYTNPHTIGVVQAYAGIAETGTLVALCKQVSSAALFLPETLVVLLETSQIVGWQEDVWKKMRKDFGGPPSAVHLITGPSRTGDVEQTIQLGAHGPRAVYVVLMG